MNIAYSNFRIGVLVFFTGLLLIHHLITFLGFYGMDDINYARYAARVVSDGHLTLNTHDFFELRWGAIYGTAFFYWIFGINNFSTVAYGFSTVLLTAFILYRMVYKLPVRSVFAALLLFILNYPVLFASHRIWADTAVMLFSLLAFYLYWRQQDEQKSWWSSLAFSVCLFLVIVSKETIILLIPLLVYLFVDDLAKKRRRRFWIGAVLFTSLLLGGYLLLFKMATGDWLYRYHLLHAKSYVTGCSYDLLPFSQTVRRIGYYLWEAFLLNGDMLLIIFGLCGFIYRRRIMSSPKERQVAVAFFILLMSANFMTFSLKHYVPLCQDPRHFMLMMPFAAYSGSYMLNAYVDHPLRYWLLPLLLALSTSIIFLTGGGEMKYIYLLVSGLMILPLLMRVFLNRAVNTIFVFTALTAILLIRPAYDLVNDKFKFYDDHRGIINADFPNKYAGATVYTVDALTAELSEYFLDFKETPVVFITSIRKQPIGQSYFLINRRWNPDIALVAEKLSVDPGLLQVSERKGDITLYKINSNTALDTLMDAQARYGAVL